MMKPYRVLEGATTMAMPLGFWLGGGPLGSVLFLLYVLHTMASFLHHVLPSVLANWSRRSFATLLLLERVFRGACELLSWRYAGNWLACGLLGYARFHLRAEKRMRASSVAGMAFHLALGVLSYREAGVLYPEMGGVAVFLRDAVYLLFVFDRAQGMTENPKRLRSVLSLVAAVVLTPLSFYQLWQQCRLWPGRVVYRDGAQAHQMLFYLSYVVVDMMFGYVCYPQYFPLLEGWFHHLATGCATLYYLNHPKRVLYCMTQVIEASTILLSLFKVLYDVPWVLRLRDQWFARLFVLFRVVLPSLVLALFYSLLFDGVAMGVFAAHMVLNLYWLCKIANK